MAEAVAEYQSGNKNAFKEIVTNARSYVEMLESHIQKENMILFSIADSRLSEESQSRLYEEFEQLEEHKIGLGRHEEFHKILDRLAELYLQ